MIAIHDRPLRGRRRWALMAWALLRVEVQRARRYAAMGNGLGAQGHVREARRLCALARTWDRGWV